MVTMATSAEIREGFLCPMCMKDLGTVTQLQSHFEEAHSTEDKAVFNHLRGLFDKAKKKILGDRDDDEYDDQSSKSSSIMPTQSTSLYDVDYWAAQEIGVIHSLTDNFRALRDARVDKYVVETNKLLIRLDKLISPDAPSDGSKRKAFEQSLVIWIPDSEVKNCPFCGRSFGMTRRRHHCRLCGGIMCDRCSHFLTHAYAKKLTNPAFNFDSGREAGFLKRSSSNSSLNSLFSTEGDPHLRVCQECRKLLERRDQMVEQRNTKPSIVVLYEKLKAYIGECETLLVKFLPIVESLSVGDSTYSLQDGQKLRGQLVKYYEYIDQLSKRIVSLDMDKPDPPSAKQASLQKAIRVYASNFMQENMMGLQNLPSEEQYEKLQKKRTAEIQKRIASERQAAFAAQEQERRLLQEQKVASLKEEEKRERSGSHKRSNSAGGQGWLPGDGHKRSDSTGKGWKPAESVVTTNTNDPMIQQMEIIRGYIKQARDAHKWDEVNMLEQNLKDLQTEYSSQQKQTWS